MNVCDDLVMFADGELDEDRADAFRDHLDTCEVCPDQLVEIMTLIARLSMLKPDPESERT